ncbi:MAG TPA: 2'-5' RNA ligase family protein [Gaiellaceae bacterium]|nr:2'-5' RNA ligase family protein [Gaiellaceae bacterium]
MTTSSANPDTGRATVLCLELADAEDALGPVRADHNAPSVARGIPLHLTLLHPFLPRSECDAGVAGRIQRTCSRHGALSFSLASVALSSRGQVAVLAEPSAGIRALMDALEREFPGAEILGREAPFTAVGRALESEDDPTVFERIRARVVPLLPIRCDVDSVALFEEVMPGTWRATRRFSLDR